MGGHGSFILCLLLINSCTRAFSYSDDLSAPELPQHSRSRDDRRNIYLAKDNEKPIFTECLRYDTSIKEEEPMGTYVNQVKATDKDPIAAGGRLTYTFVLTGREKAKFNIHNETGIITTNKVFDRDEPTRDKEFYVTVQASDNGRPVLADVCTFKITIEDVNDNSPIFDKTVYSESVPQDLSKGREVMRISATDIDDGNNSIVTYSFREKNKYFDIDGPSGVITLIEPLPANLVGSEIAIHAMAQDWGSPPNSVGMELKIRVVDSKKKAPTFVDWPSEPIVLPENFQDYQKVIASVTAQSNLENKDLQFVLEIGRTDQTNKRNVFVMESKNDTAYIKLGQPLNYEDIVEYTLTIRVTNKDSLNAVTTVKIKVTDVNDLIPMFTEEVTGTVLENEPIGTPVMQVHAIDLDGTEANNIVHYELADFNDLFAIDSKTGNITTKVQFDRETNNIYNVKVIAKDNSPSALYPNQSRPNSAERTFKITIEDKNDNPPKFTKSQYVADRILESTDLNKEVMEVTAKDRDTAAVIQYSIKSGNTNDSFLIASKTGKIRVNNKLDYETFKFYNLTVEAFDGKFTDEAIVIINIENVNDNLPQFDEFNDQITIKEESLAPGCLVTVRAYDPDISDRNAPQNILYSTKPVNGEPFLSVDKDGCVVLTKKLDRDPPTGTADWQAIIIANDENGSPTSQLQSKTFVIRLIDINDNAPELNITEVVWNEELPVDDTNIIQLTATDNDTPENGPPFTYRIPYNAPSDIQQKFGIRQDFLYPKVTFDREEQKEYIVPIEITDNGQPPMTGLSTLKVIIGDINDNAMMPGSSQIFVNKAPKMPKTTIGRVFVEDLDDWDLPDKQFYWLDGSHPYFDLDPDTGNITMSEYTKANVYQLRFIVHEQSKIIDRHSVDANVTITVKDIPDEAIQKSGSVRLHGKTAEEFIDLQNGATSMKDEMHRRLAKLLNVTAANLDIITILHSPVHANNSLLDVRFSAHGSPYYLPEKLNTITTLHQEELSLDDLIEMVNVAECMTETVCPGLSCTNYLHVNEEPYVVNTNRTSFVGLSAVVEPQCTCHIEEPIYCLNGGQLIEDAVCTCQEGFQGPQCELISIGFLGDGWAIYPTFQTCNNSELTLELETHQENGLIFYVGPLRKNPWVPVKDFMSLELRNGYLVLLLDYGTGTVEIEYNVTRVNDGKSHSIYIHFQPDSVELRVDHCHMSACLRLARAPLPNRALNVNGPLQLGGSIINLRELSNQMGWNFTPTDIGLSGRIQNLTYNGKTYDLGAPSYAKNVNHHWTGPIVSSASFGIDHNFLVALLVCVAILLILLLAVVVHRRRQENWSEKDMDDIRENIINYEDEGGGEVDTGFDLDVLRCENYSDDPIKKRNDNLYGRAPEEVPDISGFLEDKKESCDKDPDFNPFDDVRYYAYEGDGNTSRSSLSSLASCTDEGDLKFNYLSNFGPRFRKLADMYGEEPSDEEDPEAGEESWC